MIKNLTANELSQFAKDVIANNIFTSAHVPQSDASLIPNIFMPIALGAFADLSDEDKADIGVVYGRYEDASHTAINGYPIFFTVGILNKRDWAEVAKKIDLINKTLNLI